MQIERVEWSEWRPAPDVGEGARECRGTVVVEGHADVIYLDLAASPDASPVYSACWRSNGHQPSDPELLRALGQAATNRAVDLEAHEAGAPSAPGLGPVVEEYEHASEATEAAANIGTELVDPPVVTIGAGRSWSAESIEPPPVEPDEPLDFHAKLTERTEAAAARDLAEVEPDTWGLDLSLVPRAMRPAIRMIEELALELELADDEDKRAEIEARLLEGGRQTVLALGIYCHVLGLATEQVQGEAARLGARATRFRDRGKRLRQLGRKAMDTIGVDKPIEGPILTVGPASGKPRVVVAPTVDVDLLPPELVRRPPAEPDKTALAKVLRKNPHAFPGCQLVPGEPTMRIYK